jgi:hypothetical protein
MRKRKERTDKDIEHVKNLIISRPPTYEELQTLLQVEQHKVQSLLAQIRTYQAEIQKWRKGKRRLRIFLGRYWQAYFPDESDNKKWTLDELEKWRNNLARFVEDNSGYFTLDE